MPEQWAHTYFEWMRNIQPWCISRQLWWGHQIPAWYGPDGEIFVAMDEAEAHDLAEKHYGRKVELVRDEDVLDTWFSSALWPFSTLGWPEQTPELARFYPTDVLVTAYDIIFFWVARMMMMGLEFMGEVPFREVYIHGLVRDERGQKMSKSKGNVIDPLELIEKYGADALRFALLASTVQGGDVKLGEGRVQGYRNFGTKLWNAARFCELNGCDLDPAFEPSTAREIVNRWAISKLARAAARTRESLEGYRFNEAASALYHFTWDEFCDWYLELAKPSLESNDADRLRETRATAGWVLAQLLHLLHPLTPFVTEELWEQRYGARGGLLIGARWPELPAALIDEAAEAELDWLIRLVSALRAARSELGLPAATRLPLEVRDAGPATRQRLERHDDAIRRLARCADIEIASRPASGGASSGGGRRGDLRPAPCRRDRSGAGAPAARPRAREGRGRARALRPEAGQPAVPGPGARRGHRRAARAARRSRADATKARGGAGAHRVLAARSVRGHMLNCFVPSDGSETRPIWAVRATDYRDWLAAQPAHVRAWLDGSGFEPRPAAARSCPAPTAPRSARSLLLGDPAEPWDFAALRDRLPAGDWRLEPAAEPLGAGGARLGARQLPLRSLSQERREARAPGGHRGPCDRARQYDRASGLPRPRSDQHAGRRSGPGRAGGRRRRSRRALQMPRSGRSRAKRCSSTTIRRSTRSGRQALGRRG